MTTSFQKQYEDSKALYHLGDYESSTNEFSNLVADAPDKVAEGKLKIFLANSLFARNENGDMARGVKELKSVINDFKISPYIRALALNVVARTVRSQNESFYQSNFTEPPFDSFVADSGKGRFNIFPIYLKILQLSDETYPNSYAKYAIAGDCYAPLLTNNVPVGTTTPEQVARIMGDYIKKADAMDDASMYATNVSLWRYLYRAIAINTINRTLKLDNLNEREQAFRLIIEKGALHENGSDHLSLFVLMDGRFFYANFLSINFGPERYPDIIAVLKPFEKASSEPGEAFKAVRVRFTKLKDASDKDFVKTRAIALAKISPEFNDFLRGVGFSI